MTPESDRVVLCACGHDSLDHCWDVACKEDPMGECYSSCMLMSEGCECDGFKEDEQLNG